MIGLLFTTAALASSHFDIAWNGPWPSYIFWDMDPVTFRWHP